MATVVTLSTTGAGQWTCPQGVVYVKVELYGGGAAAAQRSTNGGGGGGGGSAYVRRDAMLVTPGNVYDYTVGTGGTDGASPVNGGTTTFTGDGGVICQSAGAVSVTAESQTGGTGSSVGVGDVIWPGGNGANGDGTNSGGGGEGGGVTGAGANASGITGGVNGGGGAGGNGGDGKNVDSNGNPGGSRGGGGGGGFRATGTRTGGAGGRGEILITYDLSFMRVRR